MQYFICTAKKVHFLCSTDVLLHKKAYFCAIKQNYT